MAVFHFRHFDIDDHGCGMKICSDSVLLAAWFLPPYRDRRSVADIGAGSGVLALLAADIMQQADICAVEIDAGAAGAAEVNFAASPWTDRLSLVRGDFRLLEGPFDIVISNPPYFSTGPMSADNARKGARHQEGLSYESLLRHNMLADGGHIGMVSPGDCESGIIFAAELAGLKLCRLCRVTTAEGKLPSRLLWDFSTCDGSIIKENITIRDKSGVYTSDYRKLVEQYYTHL